MQARVSPLKDRIPFPGYGKSENASFARNSRLLRLGMPNCNFLGVTTIQ